MPLSSTSLARLLSGCRRNDPTDQREVYRQFYGYAISVALHYGENNAEAEELVQDGFFHVFRQLSNGKEITNFKAYLRRSIVNRGIDLYRKREREHVHRADYLRLHGEAEKQLENLASASLNEEDLHLLLRHLTPVYRLVFNLFVLEGLSHAEIAKQLGISVGTSKSNLSRARQKVQELANRFLFTPPIA